MSCYNGKLVELPRKGKALVITDIHGNLDDFKQYMYIWDEFREDLDNHLILTGDFIHAMGLENDSSVEILEYVKFHCENTSNFHVLLGNHEWSTISRKLVFKAGVNQNLRFDSLLREKFGENKYHEKLREYIQFFKKLPVAVRTDNRIFITHAGPATKIKSFDEIKNIDEGGYNSNNSKLVQLLWNRPEDYTAEQLKSFLKIVDCKLMIAGHTPVDGIKLVHDKLLIVSSSFGKGKKAYVELDLEKDIKGSKELLKRVKYIK